MPNITRKKKREKHPRHKQPQRSIQPPLALDARYERPERPIHPPNSGSPFLHRPTGPSTHNAPPNYYREPPCQQKPLGKPKQSNRKGEGRNSLRKHLDRTPPEPLITNPTHPLLRNQHAPPSSLVPTGSAITKPQFRLLAERQTVPQTGHHPRFIHNRIRSPDPAPEIRFQLLDGEHFGYEIEGRRCGHASAVSGQEGESGTPLRFVWGRRGEIEGEQGMVD